MTLFIILTYCMLYVSIQSKHRNKKPHTWNCDELPEMEKAHVSLSQSVKSI